MVFPATPLDLAVELFVNSTWTDITSDVYQRDGIRIGRGRPNESGQTPPQMCQLTLDNTSRNYSLRNPTGAYYGSLGRNTPLRISIRTDKDTFTRTLASSWGSTDNASAWSTAGAGGTVQASDYNVAAGVGTVRVPAATASRITYLAGSLYSDVDVAATVSGVPSNVTGGPLAPLGLLIGGLTTASYYWAKITIDTSEVVRLGIYFADGTELGAPVTVPVTFTGQALRARFQLEGQSLRAKVWAAASAEPFTWNVTANSATMSSYQYGRAPGWVGIRSGTDAANSNVPVTYSYDNFDVRSPRFAGEVSSWPAKWDTSGNDVYAQIQAAGVTRRLSQGDTPVPSAFYRAFTTLAAPALVYWPMEDGRNATDFSSGIGGDPLPIVWLSPNLPKLASNSDFDASGPLPVVNNGAWGNGFVLRGAAGTGTLQTTFLLSVPSGGDTDGVPLLQVRNTGSAAIWELFYDNDNGGGFQVQAFDANHTALYSSGNSDFSLKGRPVWVSFELTQVAGNVFWAVVTKDATTLIGLAISDTWNSITIGALTGLSISPTSQIKDSAVGHLMSRNYYTSLNVLSNYLSAYNGETAITRIGGLSQENVVPFTFLYDGATSSVRVGKQGRDNYVALITEAATSDMGDLYESRAIAGIVYRAHQANHNQNPTLTLDYDAGHLAAPFEPIEDDQNIRNDVTVTRRNGAFRRRQLLTGPLSVTDPSTGQGAGRYTTNTTLSLYADNQADLSAGWLLHLGTVDEARYPNIKIDLAKFADRYAPQLRLDALAVDIGHRILINNPKSGFDPAPISQIVRGYSEFLNAKEHWLSFNGTPESPYQVIRLDSSTLGKIDSGSSTLAAGVTSSATTLSVATSVVGDLWKVAAGQSIPIVVGGEKMTVTAITGATSPQSFTVTRSVNGVVKSQVSGAAVRLFRPATLAL